MTLWKVRSARSDVLPSLRKRTLFFLALHGAYGEDGSIQKELDALGVPYTGCDAETSGIAF